ncbi:Hypothetical protein HEAR3281 [Herminiimonas arsenicoxydans]|uniref:Uncharacterized protein n=1 Tax=Herminiimonas arsenicoxydans TaxID=204773 RepID=A4GA51_HERAR|nr:Hypothetical protein HEAR3281 [Herminiimonas arsenicoxydans]
MADLAGDFLAGVAFDLLVVGILPPTGGCGYGNIEYSTVEPAAF